MTTSEVLASMPERGVSMTARSNQNRETVERFVALAIRGLVPMFDRQKQLFCYTLKKSGDRMVPEGISQRYTMMTLMGLHRLEQAGVASPFDQERILQALLSDLTWMDNIGDLGVLLWTLGIVWPERYAQLESRLDVATALRRYSDARKVPTMELAWFLIGLSYWAQTNPEKRSQIEPIAFETFKILKGNQGDRGFFGHLSTTASLSGLARGRTGSFADQVYPIYGMAQFSRAFGHEEAAQRAIKCANGICEEQGPMGQWWWHYDAPGGRVTDGYPVFSVHQHAMAPFTLFGLGEIIGSNFDEQIYRGLRWINSNNELRCEMEDQNNGVIWRCIMRSQRSLARYIKAGLGSYSKTVQQDSPEGLEVKYECRPYELGWLLYAFANRFPKGETQGKK